MESRIDSLTRITLRPPGTPLPLGFLAFATGVMLLTAFDAHWIPASDQKLVGALALGFVVPLEIMASVFAFLARDTPGGTFIRRG
jgi:succinate-acetate transporter protein